MTEVESLSRDYQIAMRLNQAEYSVFSHQAAIYDKGISTVIRELAMQALSDDVVVSPRIPLLSNHKFLEKFCLSMAVQIMIGSHQLTEEDDATLFNLANQIQLAIQESA